MKLSLNWLLDYLNRDISDISISFLIDTINQKIAEVEQYSFVSMPMQDLFFGQIRTVSSEATEIYSPETNSVYRMAPRVEGVVGDWYIIIVDNSNKNNMRWAKMSDLGSKKDTMLPAFSLPTKLYANEWRQFITTNDYIIEVDNKSITHRPDLWSHYGFARDLAAVLNIPLKPIPIDHLTIVSHENVRESFAPELNIIVEADSKCSHFSTLFVPSIENKPSVPWMAIRLARLDIQPINALVDCSNYVMLDMGQPIHLYDAATIRTKTLRVSKNNAGKAVSLLDNTTVTLTNEDIVVADGTTPIALAGIMGGITTAINHKTESIIIESGHFDATTIRKTATAHKKRTEASMRFEKDMDRYHTVDAIERFLTLCDQLTLSFSLPYRVISIGEREKSRTVLLSHRFVEQRLGIAIKPSFIITTLRLLGFEVYENIVHDEAYYTVGIPSFRCTKEEAIAEDIVEEIGRCLGYNTIRHTVPAIPSIPHIKNNNARVRMLKQSLAYVSKMRELYQYSLFDETFLYKIGWHPTASVTIANPLSHNWGALVTTLIPHLLKAVIQNSQEYSEQRFFEWGRVWHQEAGKVIEEKRLAGIAFDKKGLLTFYDGKTLLQPIIDQLSITIEWQRIENPAFPWFEPYESATIWHCGQAIGTCGMINRTFLSSHTEGTGFIFELDGDALLSIMPKQYYTPLSRFPVVVRDISMLLSLRYSAADIASVIKNVDTRIASVTLVDFFHKEEWTDKHALTYRLTIVDKTRTMTKDEIDSVCTAVQTAVSFHGAAIR